MRLYYILIKNGCQVFWQNAFPGFLLVQSEKRENSDGVCQKNKGGNRMHLYTLWAFLPKFMIHLDFLAERCIIALDVPCLRSK